MHSKISLVKFIINILIKSEIMFLLNYSAFPRVPLGVTSDRRAQGLCVTGQSPTWKEAKAIFLQMHFLKMVSLPIFVFMLQNCNAFSLSFPQASGKVSVKQLRVCPDL